MKKIIPIILGAILVLGLGYFLVPIAIHHQGRTLPSISSYPFFSIHELNQNNVTLDSVNTVGYVVNIYTCPSCLVGSNCKPCMKNNVVISENNIATDTYNLSEDSLILFIEQPNQFTVGKKYTFSVRVSPYRTTGQEINDLDIVGYDPLT